MHLLVYTTVSTDVQCKKEIIKHLSVHLSCPMMICIIACVLDRNSKLECSFNNYMTYSGICLLHFIQVMTLGCSFSFCLNIWKCSHTILHLQVWSAVSCLSSHSTQCMVNINLIIKNLLYFKMHFYSHQHLFFFFFSWGPTLCKTWEFRSLTSNQESFQFREKLGITMFPLSGKWGVVWSEVFKLT